MCKYYDRVTYGIVGQEKQRDAKTDWVTCTFCLCVDGSMIRSKYTEKKDDVLYSIRDENKETSWEVVNNLVGQQFWVILRRNKTWPKTRETLPLIRSPCTEYCMYALDHSELDIEREIGLSITEAWEEYETKSSSSFERFQRSIPSRWRCLIIAGTGQDLVQSSCSWPRTQLIKCLNWRKLCSKHPLAELARMLQFEAGDARRYGDFRRVSGLQMDPEI